ncbi:MAG: hypothetical protein N4A38_01235 [Candidatus Gracilibacteria bacterium]|nr:hypothetical protein [Candidatus Gracilibacteria bacterium]
MTSQKFSLNKKDFEELFKQVMIIYSPVLLLFLQQIEKGEFDIKIIFALIISTTIDIARRFITDFTKKIDEKGNNGDSKTSV